MAGCSDRQLGRRPACEWPGTTSITRWEYLGGESVTLNGIAHQGATLPTDTTVVEVRAEVASVYFNINGAAAAASSPGFVPKDGGEILGPLSNLTGLRLFSSTADTVAHLLYFKEA